MSIETLKSRGEDLIKSIDLHEQIKDAGKTNGD